MTAWASSSIQDTCLLCLCRLFATAPSIYEVFHIPQHTEGVLDLRQSICHDIIIFVIPKPSNLNICLPVVIYAHNGQLLPVKKVWSRTSGKLLADRPTQSSSSSWSCSRMHSLSKSQLTMELSDKVNNITISLINIIFYLNMCMLR